MVTTGFSHPIVAKYDASSGSPVYTEPVMLARGREFSVEVDANDNNYYHVDNTLGETEPASFTSGTATLTVDGLSGEEEALLMGITPTDVNYKSEQVKMIDYGKNMNPPFLGLGGIKRMQLNGAVTYRPVFLPKVQFAIPPEAMTTQEDQIDWQNQELTATIMRDDSKDKVWKRIPQTGFATEDEAVDFLMFLMGKQEGA